MELTKCFNFKEKEVVSLIGSGGKTTLMMFFCEMHRKERVLMTTTTKIGFPPTNVYDHYWSSKQEGSSVVSGITLLGGSEEFGEKIANVSLKRLAQLLPKFDKAFIEADGSKRLLLKGWKNFEPVVVENTTITMGIIPIKAVGLAINNQTIHRLPEFLRLIEGSAVEHVDTRTMAQIIAHEEGLFKQAKGKKYLVINQVESKKEFNLAKEIVLNIPRNFLNKLDLVVAISIHQREGFILWEK